MWMIDSILKAAVQDRSKALCTEELGWVVDTTKPGDTGIWETGISVDDKPWVIVEQYSDEAHAIEGHEKWVDLMRENRNRELVDVLLPQWIERLERGDD
jgi:hypothetical protein